MLRSRKIISLTIVFLLIVTTTIITLPANAQTASPWQANHAYAVGDLVTYQDATHPNHLYKCIQAHTSLTGWEPPNVPALWQDMGAYGGATATNTVTPTKTYTPSPTATCPTLTPVMLSIAPVTSPTTATSVQITVSASNLISAKVTSEAGTFTSTTPGNGSITVTVTLVQNSTNHLSVTGVIHWSATCPDYTTPQLNVTIVQNGGGPTSTNTPTPTATKTYTPTATASGTACFTPYVNGTVYVGGNQVSYNGHNWQAKWWTQNEYPSTGGSGVWADLGPCNGSATNTPTYTPTFVPPTSTPTATSTSGPSLTPSKTNTPGQPKKHVIIGYWHNFDNGSGFIPLRNISTAYDIVDVSFAAPGSGSPNGQMVFAPYSETDAQFISDIQYLHGLGKKVLISSGGYVGSTFTLSDATATNNFINSMEQIISTYGFDGMDIDWEQNVLSLNQGDTDITHPTTPDVVNTISALTTIHNHFGSNFMLTFGMETFFVQLGYSFYGGTCISCDRRAGSLLPVLYATRSFTNYVAVQLYNSGAITALDGTYYTNGGPDFLVAMTDMLLHGFTVAGTGQTFPALSPSQVAVGVPASTSAASAYVAPAQLEQAFDYLDRGISYGGAYKLTNPAGYPGLAGFMTWSINWDQVAGFTFSTPIRAYLDGLPQ
jgi:chitinase/chitodextrinase